MIASGLKKIYPGREALTARNIAVLALALLYAVMWVGGVSTYLLEGGPPPGREWAAPLFLFCAGLLTLLTAGRRELPAMLAVAGAGFAAEVIGSRYGFIFGEYRYTETLSPSVLGVPVAMTCAWLVLVVYINRMLAASGLAARAEVLLSALWMTAIDLVIDPLASGPLNYWLWKDSGIYYGVPAHNFIGWLAVSLLIFLLLHALPGPGRQPNRWAPCIGLSIVMFFTLIALSVGFFLAAGVGAVLCAIHVSISARRFAGKSNRDIAAMRQDVL
ncbi:MAG TPA: carotenoid biosynthesis protein [Blastocatellia bacterium]|nr:carotenoid biosynthesis protein [Blastocatellia bacterium]